jgi:DNA-binding transcriptional MerR regulator
MYSIGDFAKLTRIPVKTLRYYDDIGLLRAASVERTTGYRYYTAAQFEQLNRILVLKDLGCSLREIRELVADHVTVPCLRTLLQEKHDALDAHVRQERARLARAAARLDLLEQSSLAVAVREAGPWIVASVRDTLAAHQECDLLFEELGQQANGRLRGVIWHACGPGAIDCEAFTILPARIETRGRVRVYETTPHRVASLVYHGDTNYPQAFSAVRAWMTASGVAIAGPKREIFLDSDITEIQFPIQ